MRRDVHSTFIESLTGSIWFLLFSVVMAAFSGCTGSKMDRCQIDDGQLDALPTQLWDRLAEKRIYFGHQSVGYNMMRGVSDVLGKHGQIKLNISEITGLEATTQPVFSHSRVGRNQDPTSKCEGFASMVHKLHHGNLDIAFFKFCFVDISRATHVEQLFSSYRDAMAATTHKFPETTFVHVSAPLTTVQIGIKASIKRIIGQPISGYEDNINRNRFNDMLRLEYEGKAPIFDLAAMESTLPDGSRTTFEYGGQRFYHLAPCYTDDGGHLNELGRKWVATQLLIFLAQLQKD